jgi:hypothetical protein
LSEALVPGAAAWGRSEAHGNAQRAVELARELTLDVISAVMMDSPAVPPSRMGKSIKPKEDQ